MEQPISNQTNPPAGGPPPTTAPTPPIPPTPAPPAKKTNWLLIIIGGCLVVFLIIVVATVALGGFFINKYINLFKKEILPKIQVAPTVTQPLETQPTETTITPTIPASPTPETTANWKTYSNKNVIFTFKYPGNITLKEGEEGDSDITLTLFGPTQKMDTEAYDGIYLRFSLPFKLGSKSLKDYVQEKVNQDKAQPDIVTVVKDLEGITIGDLKGYTYTISGLGIHKSIFLQSQFGSDNFVDISDSTADPTNQGYPKIVEQILASFKFLE